MEIIIHNIYIHIEITSCVRCLFFLLSRRACRQAQPQTSSWHNWRGIFFRLCHRDCTVYLNGVGFVQVADAERSNNVVLAEILHPLFRILHALRAVIYGLVGGDWVLLHGRLLWDPRAYLWAIVGTPGRAVRRARVLQLAETGQETGPVSFWMPIFVAKPKLHTEPVAGR